MDDYLLENKKKKISFLDSNNKLIYNNDNKNNTMLIVAVKDSNMELAKKLIENNKHEKGYLLKKDLEKKDALHWAIEKSSNEMVKLLLDSKADLNSRNDKMDTPLILSCWRGDLEIINTLFDYKADPTLLNDSGETALMEACYSRKSSIVSLLIRHYGPHQCLINHQDKKGETALFISASLGSFEIMKILIENGAKTEIKGLFYFI